MLRVCVIGMGPIGNLHARIYKADDLAELAGVCDRIPERAQAGAERYGVPCFTSAPEMLAALKPDVVSVCTGGYEYSSDHYEPTLQALEAGANVLCEKPISNEIAKAEEMVRVAKACRRCFAVDFNHRFTPAAYYAKQWQNEGRIGSLLFVNMALWIGRPKDESSIYYHMKALNPHSVDMMRHYGGDIAKVQCFAMKAPGREMWSTASWNMQFKSGAVGHLTSSYDIGRGHPMERCEIAGVDGRVVVEDMWEQATLYSAKDLVKLQYSNPVFGNERYRDFDDTFRARIHAFVQQVADGVAPEAINGSGEDGLKAQKVIQAGIDSLNTGQIISIDD